MKKTLALFLIMGLILCFPGCTINENISNHNSYGGNTYENNYEDNYEATNVEYISDRRVQYDSANKQHIVFFGLKDSSKIYVSAGGLATIIIKDDSNTILFNQEIPFSENDFTSWTNQQWDSSRYLCGLYINDSDLQGSASKSGTLSLQVTLSDGTYFDAKELNISDLPSLSVKVSLPTIPSTYKDMRYSSYTSTVQVSKLEYRSEVNYSGKATLYFDVILKLISKTDKTNESSTVTVAYKLYDSDGIVVHSDHIYSDPIAVGESSKDSFVIYDLDPRDTYTLKFVNAS